MSISSRQSVQNRKKLENKVAAAKHMSKPDAENAISPAWISSISVQSVLLIAQNFQ